MQYPFGSLADAAVRSATASAPTPPKSRPPTDKDTSMRLWQPIVGDGFKAPTTSSRDERVRGGATAAGERSGQGCGDPGVAPSGRPARFRDLLRRDFTAPAPNRKRCGDITEIPTGEGKLYLATVIDLYACRLLACPTSEHPNAELAADAIKIAA